MVKNTIFVQNIVPMLHREEIKNIAHRVGFDLCGVAKCQEFASEREFLEQWIESGFSSTLGYMERNIDKRANAKLLVDGAKSVIVCGVAYKNEFSNGYSDDCRQKIASYALCKDYHTTIKQMLRQLCNTLKEDEPTLSGRVFADSAPVFEKRYAVEAGLGWIGRQSLLVTPQFGTFVLLGVAIIDSECDSYDAPLQGVGCGNCHRCIDACPNGAIIDRHIDTRRCISRMTIEQSDENNLQLHGWIFGCDSCQSCCPYNHRAPMATNPQFAPLFNPQTIDWQKIDEAEFSLHFATTPLSRSSLSRLRENIKTK